ncbi:MAG: multiheme c-type cytochrome [Flavobacterium sp.]|uniref:multiheme c-type cytochrome n=1 Tax=Flavobacterium sp. TaxID=239 RepID=UPI002634B3A4|nr:multiheme c-type cytochrome [Flavobacterium sp.]MDD5149948.1 multiheme c-type cytochrome [Flavobacterium sp.]
MKTVKLIMAIFVGILFVSLQSCTHADYVPVPGPTGTDGTDGVDGTASCVSCHSAAHRDPIIASYEAGGHSMGIEVNGVVSKHIYGTNITFSDGSLNSNRAFCSQCHSQEGYIDNAKYGRANPKGYDAYQAISCEGCHGQLHRSLNFAVDGNDFGLRQITAVPQKINPTNFLNASPTGGTSANNTCITCHQIRPDSNGFYKRPVIESGEKDINGAVVVNNAVGGPTYKIWSMKTPALAIAPYPAAAAGTNYKTYSNSGLGAHESPQADIWMGITGIDIEGTTTHLPAAKTGKHFISSSCIQCHMDKPLADGSKGQHSLKVSFQTCATCHTSAANAETLLTTFNIDYDAKIESLRLALSAQTTYFTTSATGSVSINKSGIGTANDTYYSKDIPLKYVQAYWNYKLLTGDPAKGVHNPLYAKALIQNSIEALQ